jgi:hypothetical protein
MQVNGLFLKSFTRRMTICTNPMRKNFLTLAARILRETDFCYVDEQHPVMDN